jgi:hypothetical protein
MNTESKPDHWRANVGPTIKDAIQAGKLNQSRFQGFEGYSIFGQR